MKDGGKVKEDWGGKELYRIVFEEHGNRWTLDCDGVLINDCARTLNVYIIKNNDSRIYVETYKLDKVKIKIYINDDPIYKNY